MTGWSRPANRLLLAAALLAAPPDAARAMPPAKESWIRVDTEHFLIFSNARKRRTLRIGAELERFRAALQRLTRGMEVRSPLPTSLFVFRNDASLRPYKITASGRPGNEAAYFVGTPHGSYIAVTASSGEESLDAVYHEYLHHFTAHNLPAVPQWLDEGLAEFYRTFELEGGRAAVGHPIDAHLRELLGDGILGLDWLYSVDASSPDYHEGRRQGTFYAQSWALTHYLLAGFEDGAARMNVLLGELSEGAGPAAALEAAYGLDTPALEKALEEYVRRGRFRYFWIPFERPATEAPARTAPLSRPELLFRLADLLAHRPPYQEEAIEEHLRAGLALDPRHAGLHRTLGHLRDLQGRRREAAESHERAVALAPEDPRARSLLGWSILERFFTEHVDERVEVGPTPEALLEARRHLRRAVELAPDDPESLLGLGRTYLLDHDDVEQGLRALERAARLSPGREEILVDLVALRANAGDRAGARRLLEERLQGRAGPRAVDLAEQAIFSAASVQVDRLVEAGRVDEARRLLGELEAGAEDDEGRAAVAAQRARVEEFDARRRAIRSYNEAIDAGNAGDLERAAGLFAEAAGGDDPELAAEARDKLARVRREMFERRVIADYNRAVKLVRTGELEAAARLLEPLLEEEVSGDTRRAVADLIRRIEEMQGGP